VFAMRPLCYTNDPVEDRASFREPLERADLVSTHEAAVALDIRCEDCEEAATGFRRFGHACPNGTLWRPVWAVDQLPSTRVALVAQGPN
jgi:hypothetical protein